MAHFELGPNQTSKAVTHRTVEEICFFISGRGQMSESKMHMRHLLMSIQVI
jgi:mannose-6-phosphate isomerase-like protein (cupin superfamily)